MSDAPDCLFSKREIPTWQRWQIKSDDGSLSDEYTVSSNTGQGHSGSGFNSTKPVSKHHLYRTSETFEQNIFGGFLIKEDAWALNGLASDRTHQFPYMSQEEWLSSSSKWNKTCLGAAAVGARLKGTSLIEWIDTVMNRTLSFESADIGFMVNTTSLAYIWYVPGKRKDFLDNAIMVTEKFHYPYFKLENRPYSVLMGTGQIG